jgi:cytochrome b pre-mRNA-processing protein 3
MEIIPRKKLAVTDFTDELYEAVTRQARQFIFFHDYKVPDTPEGRFEVLTLHLALILRRLKFLHSGESERFRNLTPILCNRIIADIEESLRAMSVSELKITRHLKAFVEGFYGRLIAYDKALELNTRSDLEKVIRKNVYGIVDTIEDYIVEGLVAYTQQTWKWLQETSIPQIVADLKESR